MMHWPAEHLDHLFQICGDAGVRAEIVDQGGPPERLERADTAPDQIRHDRGDQTPREMVTVVSRLQTDRGQQNRIGTDRSGREHPGPRYRTGRCVEDVAEAGFAVEELGAIRILLPRLGRTLNCQLSARSPLEHDHGQPRFLLELRIGQVVIAAKSRRIDFPEHASPRMLGQLVECLEPQGADSC